MKQLKISELKNSVPIEQLLADIAKQSTHAPPEKSVFETMLRGNFGAMYIDEIRRIFKQFEAGSFQADVTNTHNFNEWFCRVMTGYRSFKAVAVDNDHKPANHNYPELFKQMWDDSTSKQVFDFRPDIAVYGYEVLKSNGKIPNVPIEKSAEYGKMKSKFLRDKRDNGAILYNLDNPLNHASYKHHVMITIFENYFNNHIKNQ